MLIAHQCLVDSACIASRLSVFLTNISRVNGSEKNTEWDTVVTLAPNWYKGIFHAIGQLSMIFGKLWQSGEDPCEWKNGNITSIFKNSRKDDQGTTSLSVSPLCWRRSKSRSNNTFYDGITASEDKGKAICVICLEFTKGIDVVPRNMLLSKL